MAQDTWYYWTGSGTTSSTSITSTDSSTNDVWYTWTTDASTDTTSVTTTDYVWYIWTGETYEEIEQPVRMRSHDYTIEIDRQVPEERQSQYDKRQEERKKAEEKAKELLLDLIGKDQLKVYEKTGRLFVKGRKYDYIVQKEGFVKKIEKGKLVDLCVHLSNKYQYPDTDNVIAIKLALECEEDTILKRANEHGSRSYEQLPEAACM